MVSPGWAGPPFGENLLEEGARHHREADGISAVLPPRNSHPSIMDEGSPSSSLGGLGAWALSGAAEGTVPIPSVGDDRGFRPRLALR